MISKEKFNFDKNRFAGIATPEVADGFLAWRVKSNNKTILRSYNIKGQIREVKKWISEL